MEFDLTEVQASWSARGEALGGELGPGASAGAAVMGADRAGFLDPRADLLSTAAAVEAVASGSPSAAMCIALHAVVVRAAGQVEAFAMPLVRGELIGGIALSSEDVPVERGGRLSGRASWVAPVTNGGLAIVGARSGDDLQAFAVSLVARGITLEEIDPAGLRGVACAHLVMDAIEAVPVGATIPVMARVRVLLAALGLGIGRRALAEALAAARHDGAGAEGEQTVQGLLADAATELDAARLLTWKAAALDGAVTLGEASMAKLAATEAAQRAVERATQVIGVESFRRGHIVETLAQDVRALELFAGRTEALRGAVAAEVLPAATASEVGAAAGR